MEQLTVVGQTPEGDGLVLVGPSGVQYVVPIDSALRAAMRGDRPGLERARVEGEMRPRDIQALIRAGASAQRISTDSGLSMEHVMRYAAPVLDERAFMAEQARALPIDAGDDSPTLGELIPARLAQRGIATHDLDWDAWRGPDGWLVACTFYVGEDEMSATWRVDLPARSLEAADAEAHMLSAPEAPDSPLPRRLRAVSATPVFDFAALNPADIPAAPEAEEEDEPGDTSSLLDELAQQRGQRVQLDLDELRFPDGPAPEQADAQVLSFAARRKHPAEGTREPVPADTLVDGTAPDDQTPAHKAPGETRSADKGSGDKAPADKESPAAGRPTPATGSLATGSPAAVTPTTGAPTPSIPATGTPAGDTAGRTTPPAPLGISERFAARSSGRDTAPGSQPDRPATPAQPPAPTGAPGPDTDPEPEPPKPTSRSKRAKVPSWNEIVFGTTPQE